MSDRDSMQAMLRAALCDVVHEHAELFDFGVSERGLVHHLAVALRPMVPPEFDVDVEYNRQDRAGDMKREVDGGRFVTPDLLIHQRGVVDFAGNVLVLEAKRVSGRQKRDREKVVNMMSRYQYRYGVTLAFGTPWLAFNPRWSWWDARSLSSDAASAAIVSNVAVFTLKEAEALYETGRAVAQERYDARRSFDGPGYAGFGL